MKQLRPRWSGPLDCPPGKGFFGLLRLVESMRRFTLKVMHAGRQITVTVAADGDGLVSHAGSALLAQVADKTGLTRALSLAVAEPGLRAGSHDRGRVIRDLAVMLADGGDCLADLRAVSDQAALFGQTASPSTAFRVIDGSRARPVCSTRCTSLTPGRGRVSGTGRRAGAVDDRSGRHADYRALRQGRGSGHVQRRVRVCADARLWR